jgi:hypothetical protein
MKDPESFRLRLAMLMADGSVCYQYRAKNSFGAELPGNALILTENGRVRMLTSHDESELARTWNKRCKDKVGEDLTITINQYLQFATTFRRE